MLLLVEEGARIHSVLTIVNPIEEVKRNFAHQIQSPSRFYSKFGMVSENSCAKLGSDPSILHSEMIEEMDLLVH